MSFPNMGSPFAAAPIDEEYRWLFVVSLVIAEGRVSVVDSVSSAELSVPFLVRGVR